MAQRESRLSRDIMKVLRAEGWFCFKVHGNEYTMSGLPDLIVCAEGFFVSLETKNPDARANVSAVQRLRHEQIREAGGSATVICGAAEAVRAVRAAIERARSTQA